MVEMKETANVLRRATRRSLVVLDEIGRGTSTYDGLAIAWAVAEHLHDVIACRALFATHYHELTELGTTRAPTLRELERQRARAGREVIFLHKLQRGAASRSYGVACARLAGVPEAVVARARRAPRRARTRRLPSQRHPRIAPRPHARGNVSSSTLFEAQGGGLPRRSPTRQWTCCGAWTSIASRRSRPCSSWPACRRWPKTRAGSPGPRRGFGAGSHRRDRVPCRMRGALSACSWGTWGDNPHPSRAHADALGAMPARARVRGGHAVITLVSGLASIFDRVRAPASWKARAWLWAGWRGRRHSTSPLLRRLTKLAITRLGADALPAPIFVAVQHPMVLRERMTGRQPPRRSPHRSSRPCLMLAPSSHAASSTVMWTSAVLGAGARSFYAANVLVNKFGRRRLFHQRKRCSGMASWHASPCGIRSRDAWSAIRAARGRVPRSRRESVPGRSPGSPSCGPSAHARCARVAPFTLLEPLVSIVLASALLGERLGARSIAGGALILLGATGSDATG